MDHKIIFDKTELDLLLNRFLDLASQEHTLLDYHKEGSVYPKDTPIHYSATFQGYRRSLDKWLGLVIYGNEDAIPLINTIKNRSEAPDQSKDESLPFNPEDEYVADDYDDIYDDVDMDDYDETVDGGPVKF